MEMNGEGQKLHQTCSNRHGPAQLLGATVTVTKREISLPPGPTALVEMPSSARHVAVTGLKQNCMENTSARLIAN